MLTSKNDALGDFGENKTSTSQAAKDVIAEFMSPLLPILEKEDVTNILVFEWNRIVYHDMRGQHLYDGLLFKSEGELIQLISQASINTTGIAFNKQNPVIHASLPSGARIAASMMPISPTARCAIRLFPKKRFSLENLADFGAFPHSLIERLNGYVQNGSNILFSGATNSGKTTFMNAMLQCLPDNLEHILTIQDVNELSLPDRMITSFLSNHNIKRFDDRCCTLDTLIEDSLRATPDRIIVGEIRGSDAAAAFFDALNTGHTGVCATLHANSASASLTRLSRFIIPATHLPFPVVHDSLIEFIDVAINLGFDSPKQIQKSGVKKRRIKQIVEYYDNKPDLVYEYNP